MADSCPITRTEGHKIAKYTLIVNNNSDLEGDICVYQMKPDLNEPGIASTAWITRHVHPTTTVTFEWNPDYCFIWEETNSLASEISSKASQVWATDLSDKSMVTFTYKDGAFTFQNLQPAPGEHESLFIQMDETIPLKSVGVGIGMAGAPVFIFPASPNTAVVITPHPHYWVAFGEYEQGKVLETTQMTNAVKVDFPPNVTRMEVTLQPDNTWVVTPAQI